MAKPNPAPQKSLKAHQGFFILALIISLVSWTVPVLSLIFIPLTFLNTHLHELCHALTAVITGGKVDYIVVNRNGSGMTYSWGGINPLITCAGYVGASLVGAAMLILGISPRGAKVVLGGVCGILIGSMFFWVRGDAIGVFSGFLWIAVLGAGCIFLKGNAAVLAVQFLAVQQCLAAIQSFLVLMHASVVPNLESDAMHMQEISHIPAIFWALAWLVFSVTIMGLSIKWAWRHEPAS